MLALLAVLTTLPLWIARGQSQPAVVATMIAAATCFSRASGTGC